MFLDNYKIYFHHESGTSGVIADETQENSGWNLKIKGFSTSIAVTENSLLNITKGLKLEEIV